MRYTKHSTPWLAWCVIPVFCGIVALATWQQSATIAQEFADEEETVEGLHVLTRGPIPEAFGQPTVFSPKPGPLI